MPYGILASFPHENKITKQQICAESNSLEIDNNDFLGNIKILVQYIISQKRKFKNGKINSWKVIIKKLKDKNMIKEYIEYLRDNPQGYWFKAKLYGWGWVPVRWQGWLVIAIGIAILLAGIYVGETDDAPGAALLGFLLMIALIFTFGFWKGEKPRWQWGPSKDKK